MFDRLKCDKRLSEHDDALARVDRRLTALEIQWTDTLDRLKTMMGRVLRERQRAEASRGDRTAEEQASLTDEDVASGHTTMNQRQAAINERILARRNRSGVQQ